MAWGANSVGQTNVPAGLDNVVAIASGQNFCLALRADGTVVSWGHYFQQPGATVPPSATNIVAIAAGNSHHCLALRADGAVLSWGGENGSGQQNVPAGLSNIVALATGGAHSLALDVEGKVTAWGAGTVLDIPNGEFGQSMVPANLGSAAAIGAGDLHSLAVTGDVKPFFTTPLVDRTILHSTTARIRASVNGTGPLSYQWRHNGTNLPGATNAVLELVGVGFDAAGLYSLEVRNAFGTATSRELVLQVAPIFITRQPQSQVVLKGQTVSFSVDAIGPGPFTYEWGFNGTPLPGETNNTLVLAEVRPEQEGAYTVVVQSALGVVRSASGILSLTEVKAWGDNLGGQSQVPAGVTNVVAVSGGFNHSLALKADGSVLAWGGNYYGQSAVPPDLTNAVALAAGNSFSVAVKADGRVTAWGINGDAPVTLTGAVAVAAGATHAIALQADGRVVAWGSPPPGDLDNVIAISAGQNYSVALRGDGTVRGWGSHNAMLASLPTGPTDVIALAAGRDHCLALRANGTVMAWGSNAYGQRNVPTDLSNVVAIAAGERHSLSLKADGTVVAWGNGSQGQNVVPAGLKNVVSIAAGYRHNLALARSAAPRFAMPLMNRSVAHGTTARLYAAASGTSPIHYQWRFNGSDLPGATNAVLELAAVRFEQAGGYSVVASNAYGNVTSATAHLGVVPFFVTGQPQAQSSFRGATLSLSVNVAGLGPFSYQWQFNGVDLAGATSSTLLLTDVRASQSGLYSVRISNPAGSLTSGTARLSVGNIVAWGPNAYWATNLPLGLQYVAAVAAGEFHCLALRGDGTVVAWGQNSVAGVVTGQTNVPPGLSNVVAIAGGARHSLALKEDGTVVGWGQNLYGQVSIPSGLKDVVAIAAGSAHSLALRSNGTVTAWGYNDLGQSTVPPGLTNVLAIAAGSSHSIALRADGTVRVWGDNGWDSIQPPQGLSNVIAIASGYQHCSALKADGTVAVWGTTYAGQTNIPPELRDVVGIAAGGHQTLALKADGQLVTWGDNSQSWSMPSALSNVVAIAAGAAHDLALVDLLVPLVIRTKSSGESVRGASFTPTSLTEQVIRVYNRTAVSFPATRVVIEDLAPGSFVFNASGINFAGQFFVQDNAALTPNASTEMTIRYLSPSGSVPSATLSGQVVSPEPWVEPVSPTARGFRMDDGSYHIEFNTLDGRVYFLQYSADLRTWTTVVPPLIGTGGELQWIDSGPPETEVHPAFERGRFYRVVLAR
jgi:alpha-tubulin suppressor-like RCC1 family protein